MIQMSNHKNSFGTMENLKKLKLNDNKITGFDNKIDEFPNLEQIELAKNPLLELPINVLQAPKLMKIRIDKENLKEFKHEQRKYHQSHKLFDITPYD